MTPEELNTRGLTLPYTSSERLFRRYESYVATIVNNWPQPTIFDATIISLTTLGSRIRQALNSIVEHDWTVTTFDRKKLRMVWNDIVISLVDQPGKIVVGPKDKIKTRRSQDPLQAKGVVGAQSLYNTSDQNAEKSTGIELTDPTLDVIQALLVLHHHQVLINPTILHFTDASTIINEGEYDIHIVHEGNTFTIL